MIKTLWAIVICAFMVSCGDLTTYSDTQSFKNNLWRAGDSAPFAFTPNSTERLGDIIISVRHTRELCDSTISLTIATSQLENKVICLDTIALTLSKSDNRRLTTSTFLYRSDVQWQTTSKHTISIISNNDINGISDISIEIANSQRIDGKR